MNMTEEEVYALISSGKVKVKGLNNTKSDQKQNKYKNKKTEIDGILFDSTFEAQRYSSLKLLEKAGAISELRLQVPYELIPAFTHNGTKYRKCTYIADFVYIDNRDGHEVVEDTKGCVTPEYALKKKLLLYQHPDMDFREVHKIKRTKYKRRKSKNQRQTLK